ncbi:histone deacetylase [Coniosporium apollinis]|uniref:Histone deacetylase n=2 Tax=Coniosporium TaxID=2810619 RepID=A0ABQ9NMH9_9PEZI|nr:histone deacetylase [Cladosporium sp. JES 115]KAJ9662108.1 histone deacetylase [Coniosporium apollinis]
MGDIVQEYSPPPALHKRTVSYRYSRYKEMTPAEKAAVIEKEADANGIERPRDYVVSFHYNAKVEEHHFGRSHPMKPWRLQLTKQLILSYGLEYAMDMYKTRMATSDELALFHDREYLDFLAEVTPTNLLEKEKAAGKFNFGGESNDCPAFDGMWDYARLYSGASIHAAERLVNGQSDIAINWSGGLHHAGKSRASGFCYLNDIVLAILHLLKVHQRVLYIDIDVHHGDGVQDAFHSTDRVLTLSYHKYAGNDFFPGTGGVDENGPAEPDNPGARYSLNVPLEDGIDDEQYEWLFEMITGPVIEQYNPGAIVLQCGADSLGGDRLGKFNLNIRTHGFCVEFVKKTGRPLLLVGGGGYTPRNVARAWCHETALCVGADLIDELPMHVPYRQAFEGEANGDGKLYPSLHNNGVNRHVNRNNNAELKKLVAKVLTNLRYWKGSPSIEMGQLPKRWMELREEIDKEMREEEEERERPAAELKRRRVEKNIGGRNEQRSMLG